MTLQRELGDIPGGPVVAAAAKSLSRVRFFVTLWTVAHQAPLSMGISRQEYWSGLPFPSPGPMVKTPWFHSREHSSILGVGTKIPSSTEKKEEKRSLIPCAIFLRLHFHHIFALCQISFCLLPSSGNLRRILFLLSYKCGLTNEELKKSDFSCHSGTS